MCYNQYNYEIMPKQAYSIIRNCGGCGCKTNYVSTGEFRVNANGNKIDVWLIYQCEKCKHTYNLPIYERVRPSEIKAEYEAFLANDEKMALKYGMARSLFIRNKAEIDAEHISYTINKVQVEQNEDREGFEIYNPYELRLRTDKVIAEILGLSRSEMKAYIESGQIQLEKRYIGKQIRIQNIDLLQQMDGTQNESGLLSINA